MSEPTSPVPPSRSDGTRRTSWDASRPPTGPDDRRGADRLAPYQSDAPHRRAERYQVPPVSSAAGSPTRTTTTDDGAEHALPPSAPLAVSPSTVRHTAPPRRRRWWRAAATTGALAMLPFLPVSDHARDDTRGSDRADEREHDGSFAAGVASLEATRIAYMDQEVPRGASTSEQREAVASVEGLTLSSISPDTAVIGFHEAYHGGGLSMTPEGPVQANHNPGRSDVRADADAETEPVSMILPTRARGTDAHSAVDVAIPVGSDVVSPVDGTVVSVSEYQLYGQHPDLRIEIRPDDRPDVLVVMLHVTDAQVEVGDRLAAGHTVVAGSPTLFPFASQIDRFAVDLVGEALPHVHMELVRVA